MMTQKPNRDRYRGGPLTFAGPRYSSPPASISLGNVETMRAQAAEAEQFAATEAGLSEVGKRDNFWRAGAALRLAARMRADHPVLFSMLCTLIDNERAGVGS